MQPRAGNAVLPVAYPAGNLLRRVRLPPGSLALHRYSDGPAADSSYHCHPGRLSWRPTARQKAPATDTDHRWLPAEHCWHAFATGTSPTELEHRQLDTRGTIPGDRHRDHADLLCEHRPVELP